MSKKRNTRSWKAEAEKLEGLLVQACKALDEARRDSGQIDMGDEVEMWWEAHQAAEGRRTAELRRKALSKLSGAERAAIGVLETEAGS